ncbi:hypothetical protein D3C80_1922560 [compost metagenome]
MRLLAGAAYLLMEQVSRQWSGHEVGAAALRAPLPRIGGIAQVEAARVLHAVVEVLEAGNCVGDQLADAVVVGDQGVPVHRVVAQGGLGDTGDDGRLGAHLAG